jgi:hypothetical protein
LITIKSHTPSAAAHRFAAPSDGRTAAPRQGGLMRLGLTTSWRRARMGETRRVSGGRKALWTRSQQQSLLHCPQWQPRPARQETLRGDPTTGMLAALEIMPDPGRPGTILLAERGSSIASLSDPRMPSQRHAGSRRRRQVPDPLDGLGRRGGRPRSRPSWTAASFDERGTGFGANFVLRSGAT